MPFYKGGSLSSELSDGLKDLITLHDGRVLSTHGRKVCLLDHCVIHNPSDHPLKEAPLYWSVESHLMFRICEHEKPHPDPDAMEYHTLLALMGTAPMYDGWHPCCVGRCCQNGEQDEATTQSIDSELPGTDLAEGGG